jgi:hypothetical protein
MPYVRPSCPERLAAHASDLSAPSAQGRMRAAEPTGPPAPTASQAGSDADGRTTVRSAN